MSNDSRKIKFEDAKKNHAAYKEKNASKVNHITFDRADILVLLKESETADIRVYLGTPNAFAVAVSGGQAKTMVGTKVMYSSREECPPLCIPPPKEDPFS